MDVIAIFAIQFFMGLVPGVVAGPLPETFAAAAFGDLLTGFLAFWALIALPNTGHFCWSRR